MMIAFADNSAPASPLRMVKPGVVDGADLLQFIGDELVALLQKQNAAKLLLVGDTTTIIDERQYSITLAHDDSTARGSDQAAGLG